MLLVLESQLYHPILHLFYEYTKTVVIDVASTERFIAIRSCILFGEYIKNALIGVAGIEKSTLPPALAFVLSYTKTVVIGVACTERSFDIRSCILFEK